MKHVSHVTFFHLEPQGSALGPVQFLSYIYDLPNVRQNINTQLYADDAIMCAQVRADKKEKAKIFISNELYLCIGNQNVQCCCCHVEPLCPSLPPKKKRKAVYTNSKTGNYKAIFNMETYKCLTWS